MTVAMRFFYYFYLLLFIKASAQTNGNTFSHQYYVEGEPIKGYDEWCQENCRSFRECSELYGDDYIDLRIKINSNHLDPPGEHLIVGVYLGDTISRQSFETQFIFDVSDSLKISPCRLHVLSVKMDNQNFVGKAASLIVTFRIYPADVNNLRILTKQIQTETSEFHKGKVTVAADKLYGLVTLKWDFSLRLSISINIIGDNLVKGQGDVSFLNQGSERLCDNSTNKGTPYCEFEEFFCSDLASSLSVEPHQIKILFIKSAGKDKSLVFFRFIPFSTESNEYDALWTNVRLNELIDQVNDANSKLYEGNITIRVDQTWGVSGYSGTPRKLSKYNPYQRRRTTGNLYERCKITHRCPRAWSYYNQSNASISTTTQPFAGGMHYDINGYNDFEDWRQGTYGWKSSSKENATNDGSYSSPFLFTSLGPSIPSFNTTSNNGLVLNMELLDIEINKQKQWIAELDDYIQWLEKNVEIATLDAQNRAKIDVRRSLSRTKDDYAARALLEKNKLHHLSNSQCVNMFCTLLFNTSSLELTGAINATGVVKEASDGSEIAVWSFDSINLSKHVNVTVTGQRAMTLMSKSSLYVDTEFVARPGTLGGFPGGYSIARDEKYRWVSICNEKLSFANTKNVSIFENYSCQGDRPINTLADGMDSHNVNGPGSGSVRVILKTIETKAHIVKEIIELTSNANEGQIISGGFKLHYNGYNTSLIPHDASSNQLKYEIEDALNAYPYYTVLQYPLKRNETIPGIGKVSVSRTSFGSTGGYKWKITFDTVVGNIGDVDSDSIEITNLLAGIGASIQMETIMHGNAIGGFFSLKILQSVTRHIPHDVSSHDLQSILKEDIPLLETVQVVRSDPTYSNNCNDGFCKNGPNQVGGYIWTLTLTTFFNNTSPSSPSSASNYKNIGVHDNRLELILDQNNLTGCSELQCPTVTITDGHKKCHIQAMRNLAATDHFSLSYGGAGAGYGGGGGEGFGSNKAGKHYGNERINNLFGGSGGAIGFSEPFEINMFSKPTGRGGSGGGALKFVAVNDIILGDHSVLSCNGENGHNGFLTAGGGGSGGSVLLSAGGVIVLEGSIQATGGNGGTATRKEPINNVIDGHGGGGGGGRIAMYAQSIIGKELTKAKVNVNGGICSSNGVQKRTRICEGQKGTYFKEEALKQKIFVDTMRGAAGTNNSLYLGNYGSSIDDQDEKLKDNTRQTMANFVLKDDKKGNKPGRITFFVQIGLNDNDFGSIAEDRRGFAFEILEHPKVVAEAQNGKNVIIGFFLGKGMKHGANYNGMIGDTTYSETMTTFLSYSKIERNKWYHVDIRIDWSKFKYDIFLDQVLLVENESFVHENLGVRSIAIGNSHASAPVWIDEIFVGIDSTMGFRCPSVETSINQFVDGETSVTTIETKLKMDRPYQSGWNELDIGGPSYKHDMTRHESHLIRRSLYNREDNGGLAPFDGEGHNAYVSDIKYSFGVNGDRRPARGKFSFGSMLKLPKERATESITQRAGQQSIKDGKLYESKRIESQFIWYGEHNNTREQKDGFFRSFDNQESSAFIGGVGACSTFDFRTWKNEGIVLNYINITDMVEGTKGPFHVERPKVLYNSQTKKYVMWMIVDNEEKSLGMAGVAVSDYPDGPFDFIRSMYPDGNVTRDQTILYGSNKGTKDDANVARTAYLIRTYYATVEYVLPSAMMQPIWESVKNRDGSINFALSHHRANYEPGYDDYHDIYLQRWRKEDVPWKVICVNKETEEEREVQYGIEHLNYNGDVCNDPYEYKKVLGQASPLYETSINGIQSRFLDPDDPENNVWMPNSVPGVKAQPWGANYKDGSCGLKNKDLDMQRLDPSLPDRRLENKKDCSNIADNPIHPSVPDKLIGPKRVVERRRAKFVAISRLTDDYLDTSGVLMSFEGEMENEQDLVTLIEGKGLVGENMDLDDFGWKSGEELSSTFKEQVESKFFRSVGDWEKRFYQYDENYNDRARYSAACVLDQKCPVNFKDQITEGHK